MKTRSLITIAALLAVFANRGWAPPPLTAFTYQGRLTEAGSPVNGIYDFRLSIFNDEVEGDPVGARMDQFGVPVSNGLFTVQCDPGEGVFDGSPRWLRISVRTNGGGSLTTLSPRQRLTATPHAQFAVNASQAGNLINPLPASQIAGTLSISQLPAGAAQLSGTQVFTGPVGIGRSDPTAALDVNGAVKGTVFQGRGAVPWQAVSGASQLAEPNTGYVATQSGPVSITLPVAPALGDLVRVSGAGTGGWRIVQNPGQFIIIGPIGGFGANWVAHETNRAWTSVASSASGSNLVAVASADQIFTSADGGGTWTPRETARDWSAVASSADGRKLIAAVNGGQLYTSDDFGATWVPRETNHSWSAVASSADGMKLLAAFKAGGLRVSTNSGASWNLGWDEPPWPWSTVAASADGMTLYAASSDGGSVLGRPLPGHLMASTDAGASWEDRGLDDYWRAMACSADGNRLALVVTNIHVSSDGGRTANKLETSHNWAAVASSADGSQLVAVDLGTVKLGTFYYGEWIYVSTDFGATWTQRAGKHNWTSVASSADGQRLVAVALDGQIYTSEAVTTPGSGGYLKGGIGTAVELQYLGNGRFMPISHEGALEFK